MKKFLLWTSFTLLILLSLLAYLLYNEGAFDSKETYTQEKLAPFMKCEAGKCSTGKCGSN